MDFSIVVNWVSSVAQTRQVIEKQFSASVKEVENEPFPVKNFAFSICILCQIRHFCNFLFIKNIMFYHFYLFLSSLISVVHNDLSIFDHVLRITLKIPPIRIVLSIRSLIMIIVITKFISRG